MTATLGIRPLKSPCQIPSKSQDMLSKASGPSPGSTQPPIRFLTDVVSSELRLPECDALHLLPSSANAKNTWRYTSIPLNAFLAYSETTLFYFHIFILEYTHLFTVIGLDNYSVYLSVK